MPVLLHVSASPSGPVSHSRKVGGALVAGLLDIDLMDVVRRDLAHVPPPHPDQAFVEASLMAAADRGLPERAALARSETLIAEIEAADLVVLDTPMHNFTVPSVLKAWIDHVVRPGRTFNRTAAGKVGLLRDRPVFLIVTCGGPVLDPEAGQADLLTPYLQYALATIGLHDVSSLRLESLRRGRAAVEAAERQAAAWIADQAAAWQSRRSPPDIR